MEYNSISNDLLTLAQTIMQYNGSKHDKLAQPQSDEYKIDASDKVIMGEFANMTMSRSIGDHAR